MHRKSSFLQTSTSNAIKETSENPAPAPTGSSNRTDSFLNAIETRRTYYSLKNTSPVPDSRIKQLIDTVITHTPSSHNSQSTRLVVLLKDEHVRMWDMALETLRAVVPADKFAPTEQKVKGMREGYGTVSSKT